MYVLDLSRVRTALRICTWSICVHCICHFERRVHKFILYRCHYITPQYALMHSQNVSGIYHLFFFEYIYGHSKSNRSKNCKKGRLPLRFCSKCGQSFVSSVKKLILAVFFRSIFTEFWTGKFWRIENDRKWVNFRNS